MKTPLSNWEARQAFLALNDVLAQLKLIKHSFPWFQVGGLIRRHGSKWNESSEETPLFWD